MSFLVVHDISDSSPYAILKVPESATTKDVIKQAVIKGGEWEWFQNLPVSEMWTDKIIMNEAIKMDFLGVIQSFPYFDYLTTYCWHALTFRQVPT